MKKKNAESALAELEAKQRDAEARRERAAAAARELAEEVAAAQRGERPGVDVNALLATQERAMGELAAANLSLHAVTFELGNARKASAETRGRTEAPKLMRKASEAVSQVEMWIAELEDLVTGGQVGDLRESFATDAEFHRELEGFGKRLETLQQAFNYRVRNWF